MDDDTIIPGGVLDGGETDLDPEEKVDIDEEADIDSDIPEEETF